MGSKFRLLSWIHEVLAEIDFDSALDAFSGSGCVSYLLKAMGKRVTANDFLNFCTTIARATVENPGVRLTEDDLELLLSYDRRHRKFIEGRFSGIFFTKEDLRFLDRTWWNVGKLQGEYARSIAVSAMIRSCAKRQPRGVFTVAGDPEHYKDGRRDLRLSLREHFLEQVSVYNSCVFDGVKGCVAANGDILDFDADEFDLVYMDPPYVPRSDDNCYIKRYHFLEGLSCYWKGMDILESSRVKKIVKPYTPFSYRRTAISAFEAMFAKFSRSILVLSYSSNGFPDLPILVGLMRRYKSSIEVFEKDHRYHFGTHSSAERNRVKEYLVVGR
ncbi:MAG: DNA adenine methylase [Phycisphaerae bacterium]|nr:DNA adenine methylase [Phycisphaerae bacterium]